MKRNFLISNRFKEWLKQELQNWQTDGLVGPEQSAAISQRYNLDQIGRERKNHFLFAIYIIGIVLVGGGIISFVAAHWDKIAPTPKVVVLVGIMLACHLSGFYLWRLSAKSPRLGHALIVLGTLLFGANIGLLAQVFHIQINFYYSLFAWALGAVAMAYALESVPNAVIAIVISFVAFCGWTNDNPHAFCYYPFIAAVAFLPFSYLRRSVLIFGLSLLAVGISILICAGWDSRELSTFSVAAAGVSLLFFALGLLSDRTAAFKSFTAPAMVLATILMALNAYMLSFKGPAREVQFGRGENWMWTIPVAAAYIMAIIMWVYVFKSMLQNRRIRLISISILVSTVLLLVGIIVKTFLPGSWIYDDYLFVVITSHLASLVLCIGLIANSFLAEDRNFFWAGIIFAALIITTRFFEYETGLLLKSAVFTACGIGLIFAGITFEHYLKKRRLPNE